MNNSQVTNGQGFSLSKNNNETNKLPLEVLSDKSPHCFYKLEKVIKKHPELTEDCLDFLKENLLVRGHPDKYMVLPVLETLFTASENRPDLAEKIFPRFDDLKQLYENQQPSYRTPETMDYIYAWLKNIAQRSPEFTDKVLEKYVDFIKSPTNTDENLKHAASKLVILTYATEKKTQVIDTILKKVCPEIKSEKVQKRLVSAMKDIKKSDEEEKIKMAILNSPKSR